LQVRRWYTCWWPTSQLIVDLVLHAGRQYGSGDVSSLDARKGLGDGENDFATCRQVLRNVCRCCWHIAHARKMGYMKLRAAIRRLLPHRALKPALRRPYLVPPHPESR
jgi:hypothetical protein